MKKNVLVSLCAGMLLIGIAVLYRNVHSRHVQSRILARRISTMLPLEALSFTTARMQQLAALIKKNHKLPPARLTALVHKFLRQNHMYSQIEYIPPTPAHRHVLYPLICPGFLGYSMTTYQGGNTSYQEYGFILAYNSSKDNICIYPWQQVHWHPAAMPHSRKKQVGIVYLLPGDKQYAAGHSFP